MDDYKFAECNLSKWEYAKIVSEINTHYRRYKGKRLAIHYSYGLDNKAYAYYFENHGFDQYNIYAKLEV